jgi:uncharacterized protein (TIGR03067 family)
MRAAFGIGLVLMLVLSTTPGRAQDDRGDSARRSLVGTYKLVSGKKGDQEIPRDHLDGVVRIQPDTITTFDKDNKEVYVIRYRVESDGPPHRIAMTVTRATRPESVGSKAVGLIKVEGDRATIIYDYQGEAYPADFAPKGDTQHLFVMERTAEP